MRIYPLIDSKGYDQGRVKRECQPSYCHLDIRDKTGKSSDSTSTAWTRIQSRKPIVNSCHWAEARSCNHVFTYGKLFTLDVLGFKNLEVEFLASRNMII